MHFLKEQQERKSGFPDCLNFCRAAEGPEAQEAEDEVKMILDLAEFLEARLASGKISQQTYDQLRGEI